MSRPHPIPSLCLLSSLAAAQADTTAPVPADPYLWLEDVEGEKALAWVTARNAEST
jgi:prolyl oligopeptidase